MKINQHLTGQPVTPGKETRKASVAGPDFQHLLRGELRKINTGGPASKNLSIPSGPSVPASVRLESLTISERAMDTLQSFARALENNSLPLNALEPFVSSLEEETLALLSVRSQFPENDPLAQILDRVATITYLEAAKFRRGDYHA